MRTTITIDDTFGPRLKGLISKRGLSEFINECLREHFQREEKGKRLSALEGAYARVSNSKSAPDLETGLEPLDVEEWPEW